MLLNAQDKHHYGHGHHGKPKSRTDSQWRSPCDGSRRGVGEPTVAVRQTYKVVEREVWTGLRQLFYDCGGMGSVLFCPKCGAKMAEERRRVMHCPACGFKAHRDNVSVI
ncbi:hypothetical protein Pisl_0120 [Pyrobaculum islandicum DSM 4184]|uniref:Zinc ribbon NADH pyrophosphatase domain-containing protein n=1 Tax=Pyrobaculum islandicum (strain DSM 4184 / JCM 9189 / GEO3) TaxID=384616 RepID=A1RQS1_PYRIL|nr:hypothetical protein Pisl_0120 [Pyrobaculum islandicum DSM 4184]